MMLFRNPKEAFASLIRIGRVYPLLIAALLCIAADPPQAAAQEENPLEVDWGGHLRAVGSGAAIDNHSIYALADSGPYYDGQAELRLKNEIFLGNQWSMETHYEVVAAGGDTRAANSKLLHRFAVPDLETYLASSGINDERRFLNLTRYLISEDDYSLYHRLDRLNVTYTPSWGSIRIGRQALTWGNGMIFNPMDLFNPFAPTIVQRDYKVGDDMALGQVYFGEHDAQVLYIPRRDPATGKLRDEQSSYAGKIHLAYSELETDVMAARHFDDDIFGLGATGYLGDAAWRLNAVYTHVGKAYVQEDFFQVVANLDYSWQWGGKNIYGLLEFYYNGLGRSDDYAQNALRPYTLARFSRGDLFTLGRYYTAGLLQIELHPLVHNNWTIMTNLEDPSGLVLPQLIWDATTNTQLILGGQLHWGAEGTEYGGFKTSLGEPPLKIVPQDQVYLWLTYSF